MSQYAKAIEKLMRKPLGQVTVGELGAVMMKIASTLPERGDPKLSELIRPVKRKARIPG